MYIDPNAPMVPGADSLTTKDKIKVVNQVVLNYPLKTPNGIVNTITLRRGKARDLMQAQRDETDPARRELYLISLLAEETVVVEDLEELDLSDLDLVQETFRGLATRASIAR